MSLLPIQTFYVPLREDDLIGDFEGINSAAVDELGFIRSIVSISVAAPGTIIWYDHWEDGYDVEYTLANGGTTSIWGDDDTSNDRLLSLPAGQGSVSGLPMGAFSGGESIILDNTVDLPRDSGELRYDGGDRIVVSFPVAVTRSAYPTNDGSFDGTPGSLMAGAVEVFSTARFGTEFVIPVGEDTSDTSGTDPFEQALTHVMAARDGTEVFLNGASQGTINAGETLVLSVVQSDEITSSDLVQVNLLVGDVGSTYEMRWYAMAPVTQWSNDYIAPFAQEGNDSSSAAPRGSSGFWFYNPNEDAIVIDVSYEGAMNADVVNVAGGSSAFIEIDNLSEGGDINLPNSIGGQSGMRFASQGGEDFFVLSQVDAEGSGLFHDWGYPLIPTDQLTSQALVGLGYGNTSNDPNGESYNRVFVTPIEAATINVDFDGDGTVDATFAANPLEMIAIEDPNDADMSGATIFGTNSEGGSVNIAVAWGQDPSKFPTTTFANQINSLDLGTVVPPLPELTAGKSVTLLDDVDGDGEVDPGDTLEWTISVVNFGLTASPAGFYTIVDDEGFALSNVFDLTTYVPGTTTYTFDDGATTISVDDDLVGTLFPLDGAGVSNLDVISGRDGVDPGETQVWQFQTVVNALEDLPAGTDSVTNVGALLIGETEVAIFDADVPIPFQSGIQVEKATNGVDADVGPGPTVGVGTTVTWTYEVSIPVAGANVVPLADIELVDDAGTPGDTGDDIVLTSADLVGGDDGDGVLEAGETWLFEASGTAILGQYANIATVTGTPVYASDPSVEVPGLGEQSDSDPSHYFGAELDYEIRKSVTDVDGDGPAGVADREGDLVTYLIEVENTGGGALTGVVVTDPLLDGPNGTLSAPTESLTADGILEVGETWSYTGTYAVTQDDLDTNGGGDGDIDNTATVSSNELPDESDDAEVPLEITPVLLIDKVVKDVDNRGADAAVTAAGQTILYDIAVTNDGNQTLTNVVVTDPLTGTDVNVGSLNPGETKTVEDQAYVTTVLDIESDGDGDGDIDNTAMADSDQTGPVTDDEEVPIEVPVINYAIGIVKTITDVDGTGPAGTVDAAGDVIDYEIVVSNEGDGDLTNVTLSDPLLDGLNGTVSGPTESLAADGILAVGETWTYTGTYTVQQSDIDNNGGGDGDIDNVATADSDQTDPVADDASAPIALSTGGGGNDCGCENWQASYGLIFSAPLPAGETSPQSDNVDFDDFPGVNKAKMLGGDDFADGNDEENFIYGNAGRDYLRGDGGDDTLHGGNGWDAIIGDSYTEEEPGGGREAGNDCILGSWGQDILAGQNGNDDINGGAGMDLIMGGKGNDCLDGDVGMDFLAGGTGRDTMYGGENNDCLAGQGGNDWMDGGFGHDKMSGGAGRDTMFGGSHNDTVAGNGGDDVINLGRGHDLGFGGRGDDVMEGFTGDDTMLGGLGDDALSGGNGNDLLFGGGGQDNLVGGAGNDSIDGGASNDIIEGGDNADCIKGGTGDDLIYGDNANPATPAQGEASDRIEGGDGMDTIFGGEDDDAISGGEDADEISGGVGNDLIQGDGGNDTIDGDAGRDQINGNDGEDLINGGGGADILAGGQDNDTVNGNGGDDCVAGNQGDDELNGNRGNDTLDGGSGADVLDGGLGDDFLYGGSSGSDELDGNDTLYGDRGIENGGDDTLLGGDEEGTTDYLYGGKDSDCLISGGATDIMQGGGDNDTFVFGYNLDVDGDGDCVLEEVRDDQGNIVDPGIDIAKPFHGDDVITDFNKDQGDLIQLHTALTIEDVVIQGNDLVITTGFGDETAGTITVVNAVQTLSSLDPGDPDFDSSPEALIKLITDYDPESGEGKGFVVFEDKCVTLPDCTPEAPITGWEADVPDAELCYKTFEGEFGDTTKSIDALTMAERFLDEDANVMIVDGQVCLDVLGEPDLIEVL